MQGILFLHDQAGVAIQQLQEENDALKARVAELEGEHEAKHAECQEHADQ